MEQNQNPSLFGLNVDATSQSNLSEAAGWGRFLAIVGMVCCVLLVIFGIIAATALSSLDSKFQRDFGGPGSDVSSAMGVTIAVTYIFFAVIYFFPCMFLLRFANHMKSALRSNDQATLNESFKNLKVTFRYMGILTIIGLVFLVLALLIGGMGVLLGS